MPSALGMPLVIPREPSALMLALSLAALAELLMRPALAAVSPPLPTVSHLPQLLPLSTPPSLAPLRRPFRLLLAFLPPVLLTAPWLPEALPLLLTDHLYLPLRLAVFPPTLRRLMRRMMPM